MVKQESFKIKRKNYVASQDDCMVKYNCIKRQKNSMIKKENYIVKQGNCIAKHAKQDIHDIIHQHVRLSN